MSTPTLIVDTNSGGDDSYFNLKYSDEKHFRALIESAKQGQGLRFETKHGAEVYVPHHAISSIVIHSGGKP